MLYQRKKEGNWYTNFTLYKERIHRSTGTSDKQLAQEYEDSLRAEIHAKHKLGKSPKYFWHEAVTKYVIHHRNNRTIKEDVARYKWLEQFLDGVLLTDVGEYIEIIRDAKLKQGVKNRTVNGILELIRKTLNYANELGMLESVPKFKLLPKPKGVVRWETRENMQTLMDDLTQHNLHHTRDMVDFTLCTGLRESNVTGLEKTQIDLIKRRLVVHGDKSKNKTSFTIPLSNQAVLILRRNWNNHDVRIFAYKGEPIKRAGTKAFKSALKRVGVERFRWHDLRHTWASWHTQAGTPLKALQELGGWKDIESVMIYAHLSVDHLDQYANKINQLEVVESVTKSATPKKG